MGRRGQEMVVSKERGSVRKGAVRRASIWRREASSDWRWRARSGGSKPASVWRALILRNGGC